MSVIPLSITPDDSPNEQSISPGYIRTALTAALLDAQPELDEVWHRKKLLGRLATPDEIRGEMRFRPKCADTDGTGPVAYLLSDASSFMTGADLLVDGGHCAT
jgi:NAD(P)-dependent dehydrogenase (short-subunit alcohol dehydrogenase family)